MKAIKRLGLCGALICAAGLGLAQNTKGLLDGGGFAVTIKAADLPEGYGAVKIKSGGGGGLMDMLGSPMMMIFGMMGAMGGGGGNEPPMGLFSALDLSWTRGDTVSVMGNRFLVTYKLDLDMAEMAKMGETKSMDFSGLDLKLMLVRPDSIQSISPRPDITKEAFVALLAAPTSKGMTTSPFEATATVEVPEAPAHPETLTGSDVQKEHGQNMRQVALGALMYGADHDDWLPYAQSTNAIFEELLPYTKVKSVYKSFHPTGRVLFNMSLSGASFAAVTAPSDTPLFYDSEPWSDGRRGVTFADGHFRYVDAATWAELETNLRLSLPRRGKPLPMDHGKDFFEKP